MQGYACMQGAAALTRLRLWAIACALAMSFEECSLLLAQHAEAPRATLVRQALARRGLSVGESEDKAERAREVSILLWRNDRAVQEILGCQTPYGPLLQAIEVERYGGRGPLRIEFARPAAALWACMQLSPTILRLRSRGSGYPGQPNSALAVHRLSAAECRTQS